MKTVLAIDHEGDSIPLDYEDMDEVREAIFNGEWLRTVGTNGCGLINTAFVYAVTEEE
jgi:hypothetical protein